MKVLLTGAFGNVGTSTLKELVKREHQVRCFDLGTRANRRKAKKFQKHVEIVWGDLRDKDAIEAAMKGVDVVIHLGAIIPPLANENPDLAEAVNVGGTKNIIEAMLKQQKTPKLIFSSSVAVYGDVRNKDSPIVTVNTPFNPSEFDGYARMKIRCEELIRESGLDFAIFRFSAVPPLELKTDPLMFDVPLDTPIEYAHTEDVGLALAKAITTEKIWGGTYHIAGGEQCRVLYREYVGRILEAIGIGRLPDEAFGNEPFHCAYMDTTKSQSLLQYQRHTFDDLVEEIRKRKPLLRILIILLRPIIRYFLLRKSPYYQANRKKIGTQIKLSIEKIIMQKDKKSF